MYMPEEHRAAEADLARLLRDAAVACGWERLPRPGCVRVDVLLCVARPLVERGPRWPKERYAVGGKPDVDNVAKLVMDAGTKAGLWEDDTQVAGLLVVRMRCAKGEEPSTTIKVEPMAGPVVAPPRVSRTVAA
jgi:Holliday junction resolvase RusA-like endonuclease